MAEVRKLVDTSRVTVGFFHCPPGDVAWRSTNHIGDRTHVVFPSTPVVIRQRGKDAVLTTPNHAVLYDADQLYERELRSERATSACSSAFRKRRCGKSPTTRM